MRAEPPTPYPPHDAPPPPPYPPRREVNWWGAARVVAGVVGIFGLFSQYGAALNARDDLPATATSADATAIYAHYGFNALLFGVFVLSVYVLTRYAD